MGNVSALCACVSAGLRYAIVSAVLLSTTAGALAATTREDAIASYNAGRTSEAVSKFRDVIKTAPNDVMAHYYLGLCYQKLNQRAQACQEYQWVATNGKNPALVANAQKGLDCLGKAGGASVASSAASSQPQGSRPSVIDFSAVWCGPCKHFEPIFDKVAARYRDRVDFMRVDVDDPKNKSLVSKYQVEAMPTVVFRDRTGTARVINQGVMEERALTQQIESLLK